MKEHEGLEKIVVFCRDIKTGEEVKGDTTYEIHPAAEFDAFLKGELATKVEDADLIVYGEYHEAPKLQPDIARKTLHVTCSCYAEGGYGAFLPFEQHLGLEFDEKSLSYLAGIVEKDPIKKSSPSVLVVDCHHDKDLPIEHLIVSEAIERYIIEEPKISRYLIDKSKE